MCSASSRCLAHKPQQGAALLLVLLVTALIAVVAAEFQYAFKLSTARVENRWFGAQAHQYLLGAESLADLVLEQDYQNDPNGDDLSEDWAQDVPPFPTDHGFLEAKLEDAQGRINLNSLREHKQRDEHQPVNNDAERFTAQQKRFIRLLQSFEDQDLEISEQDAIAITEAVIDWLDDDDDPMGRRRTPRSSGGCCGPRYARGDRRRARDA